jgi:hypothetical protein
LPVKSNRKCPLVVSPQEFLWFLLSLTPTTRRMRWNESYFPSQTDQVESKAM